ncbi:MAG: ABC transporter substrate-binding protein, partial [Dehalococcoidia bacterium]
LGVDPGRIAVGGHSAGAGLAAAVAVACRSSNDTSGGARQPAASAVPQKAEAVSALIGRSGAPATGEQPARGGIYNQLLSANPPTLDPHGTTSVTTAQTVGGVYSRLMRFSAVQDVAEGNNKNIEPDLALSAESAEGQTWVIKLRQNATFHSVPPVNGHAVEAEDVKATFTRAQSPTSAQRSNLGMIDPDQIETPDRHTVVFKLRSPYAPFPKILASGSYGWIMPREVLSSYDPAKQIIGSGPFILEDFTRDVGATYKRNPEWFEQGRPYVDGAKLAIVPDPAQRLAQFSAGNLDAVGVPLDDLETMQAQNPKAEVISNWDPGDGHIYFQLGESNSPFQDIRLRQAVSLAIDRETYGRVTLNDQWIQGFNVAQTLGKWALKIDDLPADTAQWYTFDLPRAKQLMTEAGGSNLQIQLLKPSPYPRDPWMQTVAEMIASMLGQLPWKVTLTLIDYNRDWVGGGKGVRYGNYPADAIVWGGLEGRNEVDEYLFGFWHSKSTTNQARLNDPMVDAMIDKARAVLDEEERVKAYLDVQKYLASKVYSGTGNPNGLTKTMVNPRVHNYTLGDNYGVGTALWANAWLK